MPQSLISMTKCEYFKQLIIQLSEALSSEPELICIIVQIAMFASMFCTILLILSNILYFQKLISQCQNILTLNTVNSPDKVGAQHRENTFGP